MKAYLLGQFEPFYRTECYLAHALETLGVEVIRRPLGHGFSFARANFQIRKYRPDFVLFTKKTAPCYPQLIEWCKANKVLTVSWLWDLYWGFRKERPVQFKTDYLFTTDGGHEERWRPYNHHVLRQGIHGPDHLLYPTSNPPIKVAFIGSTGTYPARTRLVNWLRDTYGSEFTHIANLRGLALNQTLARIRVVVGDSYRSPNYWSNRVYEILGRGGFLLFPETVGLEQEFTEGEHYVGYNRTDREGLRELIEYYSDPSHETERNKIRSAGFNRCSEYTYNFRVAKLLDTIQPGIISNRSA